MTDDPEVQSGFVEMGSNVRFNVVGQPVLNHQQDVRPPRQTVSLLLDARPQLPQSFLTHLCDLAKASHRVARPAEREPASPGCRQKTDWRQSALFVSIYDVVGLGLKVSF